MFHSVTTFVHKDTLDTPATIQTLEDAEKYLDSLLSEYFSESCSILQKSWVEHTHCGISWKSEISVTETLSGTIFRINERPSQPTLTVRGEYGYYIYNKSTEIMPPTLASNNTNVEEPHPEPEID